MKKLGLHTKIAYGIGQTAERVKNIGFETFLFFYFTQLLGLSGTLAGVAILIALFFDALSDPLMGSLSDNWHSPHGRRHPFLYMAALPLGISYLFLFNPPEGLGQMGLFLWLTVFAVAVRLFLTVYQVPYLAMGAELTDEYQERTSVASWRITLGFSLSVVFALAAYALFFPSTPEFENGLLNPAGYPQLALLSAVIMISSILYCAWGTRDRIAFMPRAPEQPAPFSFARVAAEFSLVWGNRSFRAIFIGFTAWGVVIGITQTISTHINVYFWELSTQQIPLLLLVIILGFVIAAGICGRLHRKFDKLPTLMVSSGIAIATGCTAIPLRLLGLFPENGSPLLLPALCGLILVMFTAAAVNIITASSMMADVAEQNTQHTGREQQGIIFSALSFSGKMASALGHLFAGIGIDLIAFPLGAEPSEVSAETIRQLGMLNVTAWLFSLVALWAFASYSITSQSQLQETGRIAV